MTDLKSLHQFVKKKQHETAKSEKGKNTPFCFFAISFFVVSCSIFLDQPAYAAKPKESATDSLTYAAWLRKAIPQVKVPEIVEMLWAIAHGSQMGPGEGWFHSGQSRYGWSWLAARHDVALDGKITRQEFKGDPDLFERLDRNHDGELTSEDFDWSEGSAFLRQSSQARQWFRAIDANSNGRIAHEEWEAFFAKASKGKGYLTPDDLRDMLQPPEKKKEDKSKDEPSPWVFAKGLLSSELGSFHQGPAVGDRAPLFALKTQDGKQEIRLSDYRGKKPVVLIFGSFT
jgi:Ca2+-binding EF-hand superfamily protein